MTDSDLLQLAKQSGAIHYDGGVIFSTHSLQTLVLRIEARAIKPEHQAKRPQFNPLASPLTCTLRIEDGKLVGLAWD